MGNYTTRSARCLRALYDPSAPRSDRTCYNLLMLKPPVYFVYIAECSDGTYYTGYTDNIELREKEHNGLGKFPGAKYTRTRRPVKMVYSEDFQTRSFAMRRELELKKLSHKQKHDLINNLA